MAEWEEGKLNAQRWCTTKGARAVERQIDATDAEIDRLVYELYGLTEAEIKILEGGS